MTESRSMDGSVPARPQTARAYDLVGALRDADRTHGLFESGARVVVGVSGGGDSVALLHALHRYAPRQGLDLHVAHLDHLLRPESTDDATFVAALADSLGLSSSLAARDVRALARDSGRGLEDAARLARYAYLAQVALAVNATTVTVAHTYDDQAETVVMNLLRGSGLDGLRAMRHRSSYPLSANALRSMVDGPTLSDTDALPPLVRPMLDVSTQQARDFLTSEGHTWRTDASNDDRKFLRSRVRHDILPLLEDVNPRVRDALVRTSAAATSDLALVDAMVDEAWTRLVTPTRDGFSFHLSAWQDEPSPLQRRLLRRAVATLRDGTTDLGWDHVASVIRLGAEGAVGQAVSLPGGLRASVSYESLDVATLSGQLPPPRLSREPTAITIPGTTALPGAWAVTAESVERTAELASARNPWTICVGVGAAAAALAVRGRRPGDRLQPKGMAGAHKSLQDLFVDAKIPRELRDEWPIIVRGETILWVPGIRVGVQAAPSPETTRVVCLTVRPPARVTGRG